MSDHMDDELRAAFFEDCDQLLVDAEAILIALDGANVKREAIDKLFRVAHNLKGNSMTAGFEAMATFAHRFEDALARIKKNNPIVISKPECSTLLSALDVLRAYVSGLKANPSYTSDDSLAISALELVGTSDQTESSEPVASETATDEMEPTHLEPEPAAQSSPAAVKIQAQKQPISSDVSTQQNKAAEEFLRVSTQKLDLLLNLVGELVINQSIMSRHRQENTTESDHAIQTISYMGKLVSEIQDVSMSLRMMPVKGLFQKLQRTVRDVSAVQAKDIEFVAEGEHVELDRTIIERIGDPLTHMVRNAVDHGIENAEDRQAKAKPSRATVKLSAEQKDDIVQITVSDDGKGLNAKKLIEKAVEKGLLVAGTQLPDDEAHALIFRAGFSTKEVVSDISGRGVGMDVVQRAVDDMKGSIRIETAIDKGSSFVISLPLSLSIIAGMVVAVGHKKYVVPVSQLVETLEYRKFKIETSTQEGRMINLRGEIIPVMSLDHLLHSSVAPLKRAKDDPPARKGIITIASGRKISFEVDELLGQQQIVIKKLGPKMQGLPGIIGGAILSNGEPSLILNLHDFTKSVRRAHAS